MEHVKGSHGESTTKMVIITDPSQHDDRTLLFRLDLGYAVDLIEYGEFMGADLPLGQYRVAVLGGTRNERTILDAVDKLGGRVPNVYHLAIYPSELLRGNQAGELAQEQKRLKDVYDGLERRLSERGVIMITMEQPNRHRDEIVSQLNS